MLHDRIEGQGQLENWERPDKKTPVSYHFDITTEVLERPGFPRVVARKHSIGSVRTISGVPIAEGEYRLFAEDSEILKVKNLFGQWVILAS